MKRSEKRILTTHVGSLVRPQELLDAKPAGAEMAPDYDALLKRLVKQAVKQQVESGVDIVNDGEYGKSSWAAYMLERVSGFELRPNQIRQLNWIGKERDRFRDVFQVDIPRAITGVPTWACIAPIKYTGHAALNRAIDALKQGSAGAGAEEVFMTAVAPASSAYDGVNEYYKNEHDYIFAIAEAMRDEYQAIYKAGFVLQVDDALLTNYYDYLTSISPARYREWAETCVAALNHALEGIPEDRIRYHICFGSWHVPHTTDAPLEAIIDIILKVRAGAYSIEAANVRHEHEWRVWEKVKLPPGKILIPGVVTHHTTSVEHPRLVADRLVRYAKLVGRENVIAGTDCGFAQNETIKRTMPSVMWAKFESLAEGARIASKELWG